MISASIFLRSLPYAQSRVEHQVNVKNADKISSGQASETRQRQQERQESQMELYPSDELKHHPHSHTSKSSPSFGDIAQRIVYATRIRHGFQCHASKSQAARLEQARKENGDLGLALTSTWIGLAVKQCSDHTVEVGFACHDGTHTTDFAVHVLYTKAREHDDTELRSSPEAAESSAHAIAEYFIKTIGEYVRRNMYKCLGAGIPSEILELSPQLPARLWTELDIVPISLQRETGFQDVDEIADSMVRKCIIFFGPNRQPRLQIGHFNNVEADIGGRLCLATLEQYARTVNPRTARVAAKYAHSLRSKQTKLAFFSATPQGGGVARMRHALLRLFRLVDVDCTWRVPTPKPEVFRIAKSNYNILQGVAKPKERFSKEKQQLVDDFAVANAERAWMRDGGPLAARSRGGADVIILDEPQMSALIPIAKRLDSERPVIYRSHIQIRADLLEDPSSNAAQMWEWIWSRVKQADMFVSHPIKSFVPPAVPKEKIAFMPATTDWLDGLNKHLSENDTQYYLDDFNALCRHEHSATLAYPKRDYIIQIARFDPSKGIEDALDAYAEFRRRSQFCTHKHPDQVPQLVLCGYSSTNDPDATPVFDNVLARLEKDYPELQDSVIIVRLGPSDQLLYVLLSCARVALQLSTSEGFDVRVSEALRKGIPVVARNTGGIPLQIQHHKSGFLVQGLDRQSEIRAVAEYLDILFHDEERYEEMSTYARTHISDEVGTVGNAICWMYLADRLKHGHGLLPQGRWVWDMARDHAGEPVLEDEIKLPRSLTT